MDIICNLHPAVASSPAGEDAKIVPCNLSDLAEFVPWLDTVGIFPPDGQLRSPHVQQRATPFETHFPSVPNNPCGCCGCGVIMICDDLCDICVLCPGSSGEESLYFPHVYIKSSVSWR